MRPVIILFFMLIIAACGKTGDLYLPENETEVEAGTEASVGAETEVGTEAETESSSEKRD